LSEHKLW